MGRVSFILPLAFGLIILLPYATSAATRVNGSPPVTSAVPKAKAQVKGQGQQQIQNPLIEKACAKALHRSLCINTLKAQPGSCKADLKSLAFMAINVTEKFGQTVTAWLSQKLDDQDLGESVEQALTDCQEQYLDAMAQLGDSMVAFSANAFNDVKTWMSTALTNADTCSDALKGNDATLAMGNKNNQFIKYCSNALAAVNVYAG